MREFINIIEGASVTIQTDIPIDMLPASTKADILDMCLGPNGPKSFEKFWVATHGIMSFNETYVSQFLFGEEDLNKTGGYDGDTIKVNFLELDPRKLYNESRSVSSLVVGQYAQKTTKAPAVLVRRLSKSWKLIEGGHRVAAAIKRGDKTIPAIDVSAFFNNVDWDLF